MAQVTPKVVVLRTSRWTAEGTRAAKIEAAAFAKWMAAIEVMTHRLVYEVLSGQMLLPFTDAWASLFDECGYAMVKPWKVGVDSAHLTYTALSLTPKGRAWLTEYELLAGIG